MTTSFDWPQALRERGLRVTRQRLAVLEAVAAHPHQSAEAIHAEVVRTLPVITVQSIYTVLNDLSAHQLLRRFDPPGSAARYETRTVDNHHHAVCTECGRIEDVDCVHGEAPCLDAPASLAMQVSVADVVFHGICDQCAAGRSNHPAPA
ncbi:Fur family transcriptional regulator [Nesterenkonia sphaerica]|nr:Fur family transcriptional regulator [Nesterenkonia sphaerica]